MYPSQSKIVEKYSSPWEKFENIIDMDYQIKENIKNLVKDQAIQLESNWPKMLLVSRDWILKFGHFKVENSGKNLVNESLITSALGLALCYINRIQKKYTSADSVAYRILVIKASDDSSNQYMNFMNMIFSAEKLVNYFLDFFYCTILKHFCLQQIIIPLPQDKQKIKLIKIIMHYFIIIHVHGLNCEFRNLIWRVLNMN